MGNQAASQVRGFSLLEVALAGAVFVVLFGAAARTMVQDKTATRVVTAQAGPEMRARHALERMASEIRMAAMRCEDRNNNGTLDPDEDVNGNDVLDQDWSLSDGTQDQATLGFNRRVAVLGAEDETVPGTGYTTSIVYSIEGSRLVRTAMQIDEGTGDFVPERAVMADGVSGLRFARDGNVVTIAIDVSLPAGAYRHPHRTISERVLLRN